MPVFDLFSKRQKRLRDEVPEVYQYDLIPKNLKTQIVLILEDAIGKPMYDYNDVTKESYEAIYKILCREYGRFSLIDNSYKGYKAQVLNFFLNTDEIEEALDVIELGFQYIKHLEVNYDEYLASANVSMTPTEAVYELNIRFRENGIGYQYENNTLIRVDSTYIHSEIVKPTLLLLSSEKFRGANEEYLKAHEHYRHGRNKECLTECLKAFESTMKVICHEKAWTFNQTDTAKKLISICMANQLVPTFTQNQFSSLINLLESGIPTIRNKLGGHGQGQTPQSVDDGMTRYGMNLTGTNIIFLIEQSGIK